MIDSCHSNCLIQVIRCHPASQRPNGRDSTTCGVFWCSARNSRGVTPEQCAEAVLPLRGEAMRGTELAHPLTRQIHTAPDTGPNRNKAGFPEDKAIKFQHLSQKYTFYRNVILKVFHSIISPPKVSIS